MSFSKTGRENLRFFMPVIIAFSLITGFLLGARFGTVLHIDSFSSSSGMHPVNTLNEALGFLSSKYVEHLDRDSLAEEALKVWMGGLDPFSSYIKPKDLAWMNKRLSGSYVGIGIEFTINNDSILVLTVKEDSPAAFADIRVGDYLIAAGKDLGTNKIQQTPEEIIDQIRGKVGSWVKVLIFRPSENKYVILPCKRKDLDMPGVSPFINYNHSVAYIRIKEFNARTDQEFMVAMDSLFGKQQGEKDLILDLRGNPGGYLEKSTHLLNQLISESGKVMVTTRSKTGKETVYKTTGRPFFKPGKIVVLTDENTASASEIVAGALQDHKRAIIVGRPSFGKGLVQGQFNLSNGGALKLTIAKFYTPSGKLIQKPYKKEDTTRTRGGINPDILIEYEDQDTQMIWQMASRRLLPFVIENKLTTQSGTFTSNHFLVSEFMKQNKLPEEFRHLVWQRLKVAYIKQTSGPDAAMRAEFEVDPFLKAALTCLEKKGGK